MTKAVMAALGAVIVGAGAGWLWAEVADPGQWQAREQGLILTEEAAQGRFDALMMFVGVGLVVCLVAGAALGLAGRRLGWLVVPLAVLWAVVAAVVAWQVGDLVGPPDPSTVTGIEVGDTVPAELHLDTWAPFLAWPLGALAGVLLVAWIPERRRAA